VVSVYLHLPRLYWRIWRRWNSLGRWSCGRISCILLEGFGFPLPHVLEFVKLVIIQNMFSLFSVFFGYKVHVWFWCLLILQIIACAEFCTLIVTYLDSRVVWQNRSEFVNCCNIFGFTTTLFDFVKAKKNSFYQNSDSGKLIVNTNILYHFQWMHYEWFKLWNNLVNLGKKFFLPCSSVWFLKMEFNFNTLTV